MLKMNRIKNIKIQALDSKPQQESKFNPVASNKLYYRSHSIEPNNVSDREVPEFSPLKKKHTLINNDRNKLNVSSLHEHPITEVSRDTNASKLPSHR